MSPATSRQGQACALVRRVDGAPDPVALYRALSGNGERAGTLLFETSAASRNEPARSFVVSGTALAATCRGRRVTLGALSVNGQAALAHVVARSSGVAELEERSDARAVLLFPPRTAAVDLEARLRAPSPLDALRAMASFEVHEHATPHAVLCAGVFAYDFIDAFEELPEALSDPLQYPDFVFFLAESLITIEPRSGRATVICTAFGSDDPEQSKAIHNDSADRLAALVERCRTVAESPSAEQRPPAATKPGEITVDAGDAAFARQVVALKEHILAGDVFQVVPSRTFSAPCASPIAAYEALRALNPSPYMFFASAEDHVLFGASPETSVRVSRRGTGVREVEIQPIAGTRRRGHGPDGALDVDLDNRQETELLLDEKERAEHMMLVDLARNDVARVSRPGTRRVERLLTVERYSHVMHLVSHVAGTLRDENDALCAYAAAMNMGTLVGAPKVRAAALLRRHEATKRGPYGGAVGYFTGEGELDTAIVIRSALVKNGVAHVRAGAGVVHDSDPAAEADETRRKAASVLAALQKVSAAPRAAATAVGPRLVPPCEVVFIDNFDSFTFNLVEAFERLGCPVRVFRNTIPAGAALDLARARHALVVLSPGPGGPEEAGSCMEILAKARGVVPVLGICLGHQAIVKQAGGLVNRADTVVHGKATRLLHDGRGPFAGVPNPLLVGRYHSLATRLIPARFQVHAAIDDMAMAISDAEALQIGFQFHPESILTPAGQTLLENVVAFATAGRFS